MDDIVKIEIVRLPSVYIVGKELRYSDAALNGGDNRLPGFWDHCYREGVFAPLESQAEYVYDSSHVGVFLDWYLGDGDFSHVVGMLLKEGSAVPEGYFIRRLEETDAAWCWIKCKSLMETRAVSFESAAKAIKNLGRDFANMKWCMDMYNVPRSTTPDADGYVILDCYIPLD